MSIQPGNPGVEEGNLSIRPAQKEELDRRLETLRLSPQDGSTWEEVKAQLHEENRRW